MRDMSRAWRDNNCMFPVEREKRSKGHRQKMVLEARKRARLHLIREVHKQRLRDEG